MTKAAIASRQTMTSGAICAADEVQKPPAPPARSARPDPAASAGVTVVAAATTAIRAAAGDADEEPNSHNDFARARSRALV